MATGKLNQFLLLIWKNWIIQKRKRCCTCCEIFIPLFLTILLVLLKSSIPASEYYGRIIWDEFELPVNRTWFGNGTKVAYAPANDRVRRIVSVLTQFDLELEGKVYYSMGIDFCSSAAMF